MNLHDSELLKTTFTEHLVCSNSSNCKLNNSLSNLTKATYSNVICITDKSALHKKEGKGTPSQDEITFGMPWPVFHTGLTIQCQWLLHSCWITCFSPQQSIIWLKAHLFEKQCYNIKWEIFIIQRCPSLCQRENYNCSVLPQYNQIL